MAPEMRRPFSVGVDRLPQSAKRKRCWTPICRPNISSMIRWTLEERLLLLLFLFHLLFHRVLLFPLHFLLHHHLILLVLLRDSAGLFVCFYFRWTLPAKRRTTYLDWPVKKWWPLPLTLFFFRLRALDSPYVDDVNEQVDNDDGAEINTRPDSGAMI